MPGRVVRGLLVRGSTPLHVATRHGTPRPHRSRTLPGARDLASRIPALYIYRCISVHIGACRGYEPCEALARGLV
jgi:hypothetical protein